MAVKITAVPPRESGSRRLGLGHADIDLVTLLIEQRDRVEGILASSRFQSGGAGSGESPDTSSSKCSVQRASDEVDTPNFQAQADDIMALLANVEDDLRHLKAVSRAL